MRIAGKEVAELLFFRLALDQDKDGFLAAWQAAGKVWVKERIGPVKEAFQASTDIPEINWGGQFRDVSLPNGLQDFRELIFRNTPALVVLQDSHH